jgi:hypothetical protein
MKILKTRSIESQNQPDVWLNKSVQERLEALETMRQNAYTFYQYAKNGQQPNFTKLQKLFRVVREI